MKQRLLVASFGAILKVLLCVVVLALPGLAQFGSLALSPVRDKLESLKPCLPIGSVDLTMLAEGLLGGYGSGFGGGYNRPNRPVFSPPPPPAEYLASLDRDLTACNAAYKLKDKAQRSEILTAIANDIKIKAEDCRRFGMGRKIPVRVSTLLGATPENGWEVFYKWSGSSLFETAEVRIPQLTSPATVELPPGAYIFRAQKRASDTAARNTSPVRIIVGLEKTIECQLSIQ
jgi:hypothetical protein